MANVEKSLVDLEAENRNLKATLAQYENQITQLTEGSDKIANQLKAYMPIAEDVWGLRVFESAKSYLVKWITLGGITALIAGVALFAGAWKYAVDLIDAKVKELSGEQVTAIVKKEAEDQVIKYFGEHNSEYTVHVEELTQQYIRQINTTVQSRLGYGGSSTTEKAALPSTVSLVDYTAKMEGVRNQGQEGSVVGFAIAYALEYQILKKTGERIRLSPREIYNLARKIENTSSTDSGAQIRDGVTVVRTQGAVAEEIWPYKAGEFSAEAPKEFATATKYKVKGAHKVTSVDEIKAALSSIGPVVAGITIYESFEKEDVAKSGLVPMPKPKENVLGGHAICIVGYDDNKKLLKFINSWGDTWGDRGYGYLPYDFMKDNAADMWALSL